MLGYTVGRDEEIKMENTNGVLTVREVALRLAVSNATVYRYIADGSLKAFKLGGHSAKRHWRIRLDDLNDFIMSNSREA